MALRPKSTSLRHPVLRRLGKMARNCAIFEAWHRHCLKGLAIRECVVHPTGFEPMALRLGI